ncbi:hypothetical protein GF342_05300 [Candidatus Woesearchaeota archaeon]|nr:hypothetical protein [Candidatus Woesearchaeota archaeon]
MERRTALLVLIILTFGLRLAFSLSTPGYSTDESYFYLRQADSIAHTGHALWYDELSYGGRGYVFIPIFSYLLAPFINSEMLTKVLLAVLAMTSVVLVYLISERITRNTTASLFGALAAAIMPITYAHTLNDLTPLALFAPLMLWLLYSFLRSGNAKWTINYLLALAILILLDPLIIVFALGLSIYLIILYFERLDQSQKEVELTLFTLFFVIWMLFVVYKEVFALHGSAVIWKNTPLALLAEQFQELTIGRLIYGIGVIPFLFGLGTLYAHLFEQKHRAAYLIIGQVIAFTVLLWLRLLAISDGLVILGLLLAILFSRAYQLFGDYLLSTKFARYRQAILTITVILLITTSGVSAVASAFVQLQETPTSHEREALSALRALQPANATVLAYVEEAHIVSALTGHPTVLDSKFLGIPNSERIYEDHKRMFSTGLEIDAVELFDKYHVRYVYFSPTVRETLGIEELRYLSNEQCFSTVFDNDVVQIIEKNPLCKVRIIETT